ncbi:hypothetical protein HPDFL43_00007490 [Hoeflea phototrophica DFL-43]|uniref:Uncharacterized protein n=1 Tax=Hoeflea phototrophica (strain DSM 17068 / NCIMB 14078 / DFL-43) TaxID=411684 RepID=A0A094ZYR3_HOEPD|nr:hypothetical protein HPDFL43_00007490 [Hoeflea phototrophica DFL-43]
MTRISTTAAEPRAEFLPGCQKSVKRMLDRTFQDAITRSLSTGNFPPVKRLEAAAARSGSVPG